MIGAADVAAAVRSTLETHLPAILAAGINGRDALPAPTSYNETPTFEAIRFVKRSVLAVSAPRTIGQPERFGDGSYDATWLVSVAVWHEQAADLPLLTAAADYCAAVRAALLQNQALGGLASEVTWAEESVDLVGDGMTPQTLGLGVCEFAVRVPNVASEETQGSIDGPEVVESTVFVVPNP